MVKYDSIPTERRKEKVGKAERQKVREGRRKRYLLHMNHYFVML